MSDDELSDGMMRGALPSVITNEKGHAVINGSDMPVRRVLELLLPYRSLDDVAAKLQVRVEYVEASIAWAVANIR